MPSPTKHHPIPPAVLQRSRDFRHPLTPTENKVRQTVRRRQLGFKIRRQHPTGKFLDDSFCAEASLAIETAGENNQPVDQAEYKIARMSWLDERGCRGIRFSAQQVEENPTGVIELIRDACGVKSDCTNWTTGRG